MTLTRKYRFTRSEACPSATLSPTKLTETYLGSNSGFHGERPATNSLAHGRAQRDGLQVHGSVAKQLRKSSTCLFLSLLGKMGEYFYWSAAFRSDLYRFSW